MTNIEASVIIGADTHKSTHTVAVVSETGQEIGARTFDACKDGYEKAYRWVCSLGVALRAGIEATGSYGAGLCSYLKAQGMEVYDVYAPDKRQRRMKGKDDTRDAFQAAQAALSLTRCAEAKDKDGAIEAALALETAYRLAVCQRTANINALKAMVVKLPDKMRKKLRSMSTTELVKICAAFHITSADKDPKSGTKRALRHHAKVIAGFNKEIVELDAEIKLYAKMLAPNTNALVGIGHHGAVTLLGATGANITRLKDDAAFSMLCGVSPVPVSSGNSHHHRLSRGGNRKANCALHIMATTRIRVCEKTRCFIARKVSEGKSQKDAVRALKRYLAREVFGSLRADLRQLGYVS